MSQVKICRKSKFVARERERGWINRREIHWAFAGQNTNGNSLGFCLAKHQWKFIGIFLDKTPMTWAFAGKNNYGNSLGFCWAKHQLKFIGIFPGKTPMKIHWAFAGQNTNGNSLGFSWEKHQCITPETPCWFWCFAWQNFKLQIKNHITNFSPWALDHAMAGLIFYLFFFWAVAALFLFFQIFFKGCLVHLHLLCSPHFVFCIFLCFILLLYFYLIFLVPGFIDNMPWWSIIEEESI